MGVPSREEVRAAAERVQRWLEGGCSSWGVPTDDVRTVCEAALRRCPPAPRDPRADYVERFATREGYGCGGDEFPTAGV